MDGVDFLSTHERDLPDGTTGSGSSGHSEYLQQETTSQYNLAVTVAGLPDRQATEGSPPLFRDGRPTGDFYSAVPDTVHQGVETGRDALEVAGAVTEERVVEEGLEEAWDRARDFRLPNPDQGAVVRVTPRLRAVCLAFVMVLATACGTDSSPATEERPAMKDRPAMETMVKRYKAMQADVFDSLEKEFGAKPWEVQPNSLGGGRAGCGDSGDDPEGEQVRLPPMSFMGTYTAADWDAGQGPGGGGRPQARLRRRRDVKDEPGDLDMVGEDKYGGRTSSGWRRTRSSTCAPAATAGTRSPHRRLDAMTAPDPTADARLVAVELAHMVGRVSARGNLPESFADQLLAPEADGALAILIDTADTAARLRRWPRPGAARPARRRSDHLPDRVSRSRAVVPLVESLRHHPEIAAELLSREQAVDALVGGPRRPRLERALVRVLLAVAPLRSPATVATVVRRLGRADVDLDRLAHGVTALLVECFDDLAGMSLGSMSGPSCPPTT